MGKTKFTVARFVKVMSGGKIAPDESLSVARDDAARDKAELDGMLSQMKRFGLTSPEIQTAIDRYQAEETKASGLASKSAQRKAYNTLARDTHQDVKSLAVPFARWKQLASRQNDLSSALVQTLNATRAKVDKISHDKLKAGLNDKIGDISSEIVRAATTTELEGKVAALERLQAELTDSEVELYVRLSEEFEDRRNALAAAIAAAENQASSLTPPAFAKLRSDRINEIKTRQKVLKAPVKTLFHLMEMSQDLSDLTEELEDFDPSAVKDEFDKYEKIEAALTKRLSDDASEVAKLPASPLQTALQKNIDDCRNALVPAARLSGPKELVSAMVKLLDLDSKYRSAGHDATIKKATDFLRQKIALDTAYSAKFAEAGKLPKSLIRDGLKGSLNAMHGRAIAFPAIGKPDELFDKFSHNVSLTKEFEDFDIHEFQRHAASYQDAKGEFLSVFLKKSGEVDGLADGPLKKALKGTLKEIEDGALPLDQIASLSELAEGTKKLDDLEAQAAALDVSKVKPVIDEYEKALAEVTKNIDDKAKKLSGDGPKKALRLLFQDELDKFGVFTSVDDASGKIDHLKGFAKRIEERSIDVPDNAKRAIASADKRAAIVKSKIDKIPDKDRQRTAQEAFDAIQATLDQVKIGKTPDTMSGYMNVGHKNKGKLERVKISGSEHAQATLKALKALETALDDSSSTDIKMLEIEGGEVYARSMCKMYSTLAAFGSKVENISPAEALAIRCYTGIDYSDMNLNRRGIKADPRLDFLNKTCDEALKQMPPYPDVAWPTFRAETAWSQEVVDKRYGKGRKFVCGVLWSTGARGVADISRGSPPFIHVIYGKKGKDVAALSANPGEGAMQQRGYDFNPAAGRGEVLFPADSNFFVRDRVDPPGAPESIRYSTKNAPRDGSATITTTLKELTNG